MTLKDAITTIVGGALAFLAFYALIFVLLLAGEVSRG